jgi:hypothetical protein
MREHPDVLFKGERLEDYIRKNEKGASMNSYTEGVR